jgi:cysteate synthase
MGDRHYVIQCRVCETTYEDDGLLLDCPRSHEPGLLGALYQTKTFEPDVAADGIYRYHRWLAIVRPLHGSGRTVTYQSDRLNRVVGLPNLWVAFNSY